MDHKFHINVEKAEKQETKPHCQAPDRRAPPDSWGPPPLTSLFQSPRLSPGNSRWRAFRLQSQKAGVPTDPSPSCWAAQVPLDAEPRTRDTFAGERTRR